MNQQLPPFSWLQAFEATARNSSFTRAALELGITQAAISHRIRNLEELVGTRLFVRDGNSVSLTAAAHDFLASIRAVIDEVRLATDRVSHCDRGEVLTIAATGSFQLKCLFPLLPRFRQKHPNIKLRIRKLSSIAVNQRFDYDVAIQYGKGDSEGRAERICREEVFPVCSPALMQGKDRLRTPDDLERHTIIRVVSPVFVWDEWPRWFEASGYPNVKITNELFCDVLYPSIQAAIDGLGVVMGRNLLVQHDLDAGRLVEPFSTRLATDSGYYLTLSAAAEREQRPIVTLFRDWLIEAVGDVMNAGATPRPSVAKSFVTEPSVAKTRVPSTTGA
jgi:LysR family glycine cleavage system transcriptional activator